jgi:hypothetical protein
MTLLSRSELVTYYQLKIDRLENDILDLSTMPNVRPDMVDYNAKILKIWATEVSKARTELAKVERNMV